MNKKYKNALRTLNTFLVLNTILVLTGIVLWVLNLKNIIGGNVNFYATIVLAGAIMNIGDSIVRNKIQKEMEDNEE